MSLVEDVNNIRLGIAGMVAENGHPYSWAAIINGYDAAAMSNCGFDAIPAYLSQQKPDAFGLVGVRVTHIWCDDVADARKVAKASRIEHVVSRPEDLIGNVDAVLIPTDIGSEHLQRAQLFVDAGLPLFIDKPLTDNLEDLHAFCEMVGNGAAIMSSSCMRYSRRFAELRQHLDEIGDLRLVTMTMCKDWARYGIHALEAVYPMLPSGGFEFVHSLPMLDPSAQNRNSSLVQVTHACGVEVLITMVDDLFGSMGVMHAYGTKGHVIAEFNDSFDAFKAQLSGFVAYLRTGERPFAFSETIELMVVIALAAEQSRCSVTGKRESLIAIAKAGSGIK